MTQLGEFSTRELHALASDVGGHNSPGFDGEGHTAKTFNDFDRALYTAVRETLQQRRTDGA